ncbi:DNA-binding CsgD family transcriptional regulator [Hydrogenophaga palleronii]|uniref:DNA-binding CsgD family transcriptional regulator n=1 Tax=Hydrogenophaga palleronii TaxID=65655 RepID=A0ABU1WRU6_9BURK|nr:LuxR C-terminal-related transcriptional regulator [Hydrogenophaga palleronii]MDR7152033.1 DNA-binding CsgD family transcriptional regulator [Hydrogenophaga palleronii]
MPALPLVDLSELIRRIYAASRTGEVNAFQRRAIDLLRRHVGFDKAWWGRGSVADGRHSVHCSFGWKLPQDIAERFNLTDPDNVVARTVVRAPGRAHYFPHAEFVSQPSTRDLADHMEIWQSICLCELDAETGLTTFISLARNKATPRFTRADMEILELVAPHLSAALDMALADEMAAQRNADKTALLVADAMGAVYVAEPGVLANLRTEWPDWTGPLLPDSLMAQIRARKPDFIGRELQAAIRWSGDHVFLSVRRRDPKDMLTRQERAVGLAFAAGNSYREVAEQLQMSPATVRHHLRSAYVKMGVRDKAAFATRLAGA